MHRLYQSFASSDERNLIAGAERVARRGTPCRRFFCPFYQNDMALKSGFKIKYGAAFSP